MTIGFDGEVAIITGAGGGLGRCHALELAKRGARIVVNDIGTAADGTGTSAGPADAVAQEVRDLGGEAVADTSSVASPAGGESIVKTAVDAFGTVDIVVNNAGILRDKAFHNLTPEMLDAVIDVHLKGAFYVTRPAFAIMREKGYGRIINTASNAGLLGNFGQSNYGAVKMGLVGFTHVLAVESARYDIKVNAIAPVAATRMTAEILGDLNEHLGPETVSPVVAFLASRDCPVNGQVFSVAGGVVSRFFVGLSKGIYDQDLTAESVRDRFDEICDLDGFDDFAPGNTGEIRKLARLLSPRN